VPKAMYSFIEKRKIRAIDELVTGTSRIILAEQ